MCSAPCYRQQHSEHVRKVHEGAFWCVTPRPYGRPMEKTRWPGCERITGRWTMWGLSVAERERGRKRKKKESEEEEECARLPTPEGKPHEASEDFFFFGRWRKPNLQQRYKWKFPLIWQTTAQIKACVCVCEDSVTPVNTSICIGRNWKYDTVNSNTVYLHVNIQHVATGSSSEFIVEQFDSFVFEIELYCKFIHVGCFIMILCLY